MENNFLYNDNGTETRTKKLAKQENRKYPQISGMIDGQCDLEETGHTEYPITDSVDASRRYSRWHDFNAFLLARRSISYLVETIGTLKRRAILAAGCESDGYAVILAAGLTPAWQQILTFRHFATGEVNRAQTSAWCASGKVLNVGCALHHLGVNSQTLCVIGGASGQQTRSDFEQLGVPVRWVHSDSATRICTTILDESTGVTTELVENPYPLTTEELDNYALAFTEEAKFAEFVVLSGSMPAGVPADFMRRLLEQTSAPVVLDIRGPELDEALSRRPFLVKPNREELARTVGRPLDDEQGLIDAMAELRSRGAEWVVVSQGPAPLMALGPQGLIKIQPPKIAVRNPIGCGDCLAAGIAAGLQRGFDVPKALEIGIRAAAENAQELLPARKLTRLS